MRARPWYLGLHLGVLLSAILAAATCRAAGIVVEICDARLTDRGLSLVVDSYVPTTNMISGFRLKDRRQFLLHCTLPEAGGRIAEIERVQLPAPPGDDDSKNEFVIAASGNYVVRVRDLSTVIVDQKAYAAGTIEILKPDKNGANLRIAGAWEKRPFFLSPSAGRLVLKDGETVKAFDLTGPQPKELHDQNLDRLFAASGSRFHDEIKAKADTKVANMVDSPPDYLGLTDDLDYGSADGGEIYSRVIYDRAKDIAESVPWRRDVVGSDESVNTVQVRKSAGEWQSLGMIWMDKSRLPSGLAILDREGRILRRSAIERRVADGYAMGKFRECWEPDRSAVVVFRNLPVDHLETWRFDIWRYRESKSEWSMYDVDSGNIFRVDANGATLKPSGGP